MIICVCHNIDEKDIAKQKLDNPTSYKVILAKRLSQDPAASGSGANDCCGTCIKYLCKVDKKLDIKC